MLAMLSPGIACRGAIALRYRISVAGYLWLRKRLPYRSLLTNPLQKCRDWFGWG